jgi:hypothetical protein
MKYKINRDCTDDVIDWFITNIEQNQYNKAEIILELNSGKMACGDGWDVGNIGPHCTIDIDFRKIRGAKRTAFLLRWT